MRILKENGLKVTPQRLDIMRFLDGHRTHPTADQIYTTLKKNNPALSKTTVYNTLEVLSKYHVIQVITISGSELRYDFKSEMHHHFFCTECEKIKDIDIACPNINNVEKMGHRIDEVHGYFKGLCKNCIKGRKSKGGGARAKKI